jgi:hypothetical protein
VDAMITGSVMTASVRAAARIDFLPSLKFSEVDEGAHAEESVHDAGHAGQVHDGEVDDAVNQLSLAYSLR